MKLNIISQPIPSGMYIEGEDKIQKYESYRKMYYREVTIKSKSPEVVECIIGEKSENYSVQSVLVKS